VLRSTRQDEDKLTDVDEVDDDAGIDDVGEVHEVHEVDEARDDTGIDDVGDTDEVWEVNEVHDVGDECFAEDNTSVAGAIRGISAVGVRSALFPLSSLSSLSPLSPPLSSFFRSPMIGACEISPEGGESSVLLTELTG
jgi:hypothetical protein